MPFIVPAKRNIQEEAFGSYLIGLQENRVEQERIKKQEQAADAAGNASLGAGIGAIAGIVLAPFTFGASLAAVSLSATVGSAVGRAAGAALSDGAPPGFVKSQVGQGLGQVAQGLVVAMQTEANAKTSEEDKQVARTKWLALNYGTDAPRIFQQGVKDLNVERESQGLPPLSEAQTFRRVLARESDQFQRSQQINAAARDIGKQRGLQEFQQEQAFINAPLLPDPLNPELMVPVGYDLTSDDKADLVQIRSQRTLAREMGHKEGFDSPAYLEPMRQADADMRRLAHRVRRSPNGPGTVGEYRARNMKLPAGFTPFEKDGKTGLSSSDGGAVSQIALEGAEVTDPGSPITWGIETKTFKRFFKSMKLPNGQVIYKNQPFIHPDDPDAVMKYIDDDGKLQDWVTRKASEDPALAIHDTVLQKLLASDKVTNVAEAAGIARKAAEEIDLFKQRQAELQRADAKFEQNQQSTRELVSSVNKAQSANEVMEVLAQRHTQFADAAVVIKDPENYTVDQIVEAGRIYDLVIRDMLGKVRLRPSIQKQIDQETQHIIDVVRQAKQR